jgi:hypothetical protein
MYEDEISRLKLQRQEYSCTSRRKQTDMSDDLIRPLAHWKLFSFAQSNPDGPRQGDVPALLRRVADTIDSLGDTYVMVITFHAVATADEDDLLMAVYYYADPDHEGPNR